jgi:hypothetical protein
MKALCIFLCVVFALVPFFVYVPAIVKGVQFDAQCLSYLKLAADANDTVIAEQYLSTAIKYLEDHNATSGNTSIIVQKPTNDIGIWYQNLKAAQAQLQEFNASESTGDYKQDSLAESNILMKLRETLMDNGAITYPFMLEFAPNSVAWFWWMCLIWLLFFLAAIFGIVAYEEP